MAEQKYIRVGDTLTNIIDSKTGESVNYEKTTVHADGSPMTDLKADGVIYRKLGTEYFKRVYNGIVSLDWFGSIGEDINNNTTLIQKAVNSIKYGDILELPNNTYKIGRILLKDGITIKGNNSLILQSTNEVVFEMFGSWPVLKDVTNIENVFVTKNGSNRIVTKVYCNTEGINPEDILKIYSQDLIPTTSVSGRYIGEFVKVVEVEPTYLLLNDTLRDKYITNIRLGKFGMQTVNIDGFRFKYNTDIPLVVPERSGAGDGAFIRLSSLYNPQITNCYVEDSIANAIVMHSCYGYYIDNLRAKDLPDEPDINRWGYGVCDANSEFGIVSNSIFENLRHGFTTNTYRVIDAGEPANYGRSAYFNVSNCRGFGGFDAHFDTHDGAVYGTFTNCQSVKSNWANPLNATTALGFGFDIRSSYTTLINCSCDCDAGINVVTPLGQHGGDSEATQVKGVKIIGFQGNVKREGIVVINAQVEISDSTVKRQEVSYNLSLSNPLIRFEDSKLRIDNFNIIEKGYNDPQCIVVRSSTINWDGGNVDLSEVVLNTNNQQIGSNYNFISIAASTKIDYININNLDIVLKDRVIGYLVRLTNGLTGYSFYSNNINCFVTTQAVTISTGSSFTRRIIGGSVSDLRVVEGFTHEKTNISNFRYIDFNSGGFITNNNISLGSVNKLQMYGKADNNLFYTINPNITDFTIDGTSILSGKFLGQKCTVKNINTVRPVVFPSGLANTSLTSNFNLSPRKEITFSWSGSSWDILSSDFSDINNKPTTLNGYGITDGATTLYVDNKTWNNTKINTTQRTIPNSDYTIPAINGIYFLDAALFTANRLITLPNTPTIGDWILFNNRNSSYDISINISLVLPNGGNISILPKQAITKIWYDGSNWRVEYIFREDLVNYVKKISNEDIEITDPTKGIILKSPNGTRYRITIDNTGEFVKTQL